MGNKAGYAEAILWTLGLTAGKSASAYVWAEADDDVRALLQAYPDPAMLLRIAEIIRGWADEEPRALWERLRAERKARTAGPDATAAHLVEHIWTIPQAQARGAGPSDFSGGHVQTSAGLATATATLANFATPADNVAAWIQQNVWSYEQGNVKTGFVGPGDRRQDTTATATATATATLAEFAMLASSNPLINMAGPNLMNTGNGGTRFGGDFATPAGDVADKFERVAGELAAHVVTGAWAMRSGIPESGYTESRTGTGIGEGHGDDAFAISGKFERVRSNWPPVAVLPRIPTGADLSALLGTSGDLEGVVVYMDPPYLNTTGYLHDLGRGEVIGHALDLSRMGATVAISEAEAIPELVAAGWHVADLTAGRKGQKRTFSKQQGEYLTMTSEPRYTIPEQVGLFGTP